MNLAKNIIMKEIDTYGSEEKWPFSRTCIINFYRSDKKVMKAKDKKSK